MTDAAPVRLPAATRQTVDGFVAGLVARFGHTGVANLLGLHFVKTGRLDPDDARLFARLQKYRIEADYSVGFVLTRDAVEEDLAACRGFIDRARAVIASAFPRDGNS